ncbi:hypothetical protein V8D89_010376 [Ganoderma adspersum]
MRLLDTTTGEFRWINGPLDAPYAILSHTWVQDGEQSYQDILAIQKYAQKLENTSPEISKPVKASSKIQTIVHKAATTCLSILGVVSVFLWLATHRRRSCQSILWRAYDNYTRTFVTPHLDWLEPLLASVQRTRSGAPVSDDKPFQEEFLSCVSQPSCLTPPSILLSPEVSMKLRNACALARVDGYELLWVDSCCIDKTSSAELSEAINSMFEWYSRASICYVYLADVDDDDDAVIDLDSQFRRARWHTRGWTLQELIAPRYLVFFSRNWKPLGTKSTLSRVIEEVTGVDRAILNQEQAVYTASVARRMSWASRRETSRVEDQAYSLLGIFGLHLATNYGEGRHAFVRLQEAILLAIPDQSIFAWGDACAESLASVSDLQFLLAPSPVAFAFAGQVRPLSHQRIAERLGATSRLPLPEYQTTSYGIRTRFPMISFKQSPFSPSSVSFFFGSGQYAICAPLEQPAPFAPTHFAILECEDSFGRLVALPISRAASAEKDQPADQESKVDVGWVRADTDGMLRAFRTVSLSPADLVRVNLPIQSLDVLIRGQPLLEDDVSLVDSLSPWSMQDESSLLTRRTIHLCDWSHNLLAVQGFSVTHAPRLEGLSNAVDGPFPRTGLFHRKDDIFLLSSIIDGAEDILIRLGRDPEAMEATVYRKNRSRLGGEWRLVKGGERIFALRAEAANIAWMTFDLPARFSLECRALRLSLHNVTRSFRQCGAIREYFFNLTIELTGQCPPPNDFTKALPRGERWSDGGDLDPGTDDTGGLETETSGLGQKKCVTIFGQSWNSI